MSKSPFIFWKHNRIDGSFPLTEEELKIRFTEWIVQLLHNQAEAHHLYYYSSDIVIRIFLSDPNEPGLGIVYTEEQFQEIRTMLKTTLSEKLQFHQLSRISTINIEGTQVQVKELGSCQLIKENWPQVLSMIIRDLENGKGVYTFQVWKVMIEWKIISPNYDPDTNA